MLDQSAVYAILEGELSKITNITNALLAARKAIAIAMAEKLARPNLSPEEWERLVGTFETERDLLFFVHYARGAKALFLEVSMIEKLLSVYRRLESMAAWLFDERERLPEQFRFRFTEDRIMEVQAILHAKIGVMEEGFSERKETGFVPEHLFALREVVDLVRLAVLGEPAMHELVKESNAAFAILREHPRAKEHLSPPK